VSSESLYDQDKGVQKEDGAVAAEGEDYGEKEKAEVGVFGDLIGSCGEVEITPRRAKHHRRDGARFVLPIPVGESDGPDPVGGASCSGI
tara:strand:- start:680 stop:946 length:267 start_codon:yes stop_codon:yes gene_type:complete